MNDVVVSDTMRVLDERVSVRQYSEQSVTEAQVDAVLRSALPAPTSSNIQSYSVVVVRDPETKAGVAKAAGNQQHVIDCPVFLAFCADLTRIELAMARDGHTLENNLELGLVASLDAALVGMAASLAAESVGLREAIGGARNDPEEIARLLDLPQRVYCVYGCVLAMPKHDRSRSRAWTSIRSGTSNRIAASTRALPWTLTTPGGTPLQMQGGRQRIIRGPTT